jgi:Holliday junction resolvasome RuvABC endonuclease subunit
MTARAFVDPGTTSCGYVILDDRKFIASGVVTASTKQKNRHLWMATQVTNRMNPWLITALVCEEPKLSGRFQSRGQSTMDRFIGALQALCYERQDTSEFVYVHPMTLKAYYKAARTDKLDMALKVGEILDESCHEALAAAIEAERFDETDAFAIAGWWLGTAFKELKEAE